MRKLILAVILLPVLLVLGIGIWLLIEHGSGKSSWLAWKAQRIAQGDRFDWKLLAPPEIPDAENFAMAPLIAGAVMGKDIDPRFKALEPPKLEKEWGDWKEGRRIDLEACAAAYKTKDLLKTLAPFEATLKELDEASRRPYSRIPVDYADPEIPGLIGFRSALRTLRLRALVHLSRGNSNAALEDVLTCLRIAKHLKAEPHLIAMLLRTAALGFAMHPVWEGLLDHRWSGQQLEEIQKEFQCADLLASSRLAFEGERLMLVQSFMNSAEELPIPRRLQDSSDPKQPPRVGWLGRGFLYRNLLEIDRFHAACFLDVVHPPSQRVFPERQVDPDKWVRDRWFRKDLAPALIALPAIVSMIPRAARVQSGLDQAVIACALERHRLSKGTYPAFLAELSPTFMANLPHDLVNGKELRYQRRDKGFQLYSVGWDLKDDGGGLGWSSDPKPALDPAKGDWVWMTATQ